MKRGVFHSWLLVVALAAHSAFAAPEPADTVRLDNLIELGDRAIANYPYELDSITTLSFELANQLGDKERLAYVYSQIGIGRAMHSDLGPAIQAFQKSWALSLELDDLELQVNALTNMAGVHQYAGQPEKAVEKLERALSILEGTEYSETRASTQLSLGIVYKSLNKIEEAKAMLKSAMVVFDDEENIARYLICVEELGNIMEEEGSLDAALLFYQFVLKGRDYNSEKAHLASIYQRIGSLYLKKRDYMKAAVNLGSALRWADMSENQLGIDSTLTMLIECSTKLGNVEQTAEYSKRLIQYHKDQQAKRAEETIAVVEAEYLRSERELENRLLKAESEQARAELSRSNTLLVSLTIIAILLFALSALVYIYFRRERQLSKQLEEKVKEKTAEVVRRNERIQRMSYDLVHELRGGVATILGLKGIMDEKGFPQQLDIEVYEGFIHATEKLDYSIKKMVHHLEDDEKPTS